MVSPALAFAAVLPRWLLEGAELDASSGRGTPNPQEPPLFDRARALGVGFLRGIR